MIQPSPTSPLPPLKTQAELRAEAIANQGKGPAPQKPQCGAVAETVQRESRIIEVRKTLEYSPPQPEPWKPYGKKERDALAVARTKAAEAALAPFFAQEAECGFPISGEQQKRLRDALVLNDCIGVVAHERVFGPPVVTRTPVAPQAPPPPAPAARKTK